MVAIVLKPVRRWVDIKRFSIREGQNTIASQGANLHFEVSRAEAAKLLNVSRRSLNTANKVQKHAIPELVDQVSQGCASVSAAAIASDFEDDVQEEIIGEIAAGGKPSKVIKKHVHVAQNSGKNEWYTPVKFIKSAREVMGQHRSGPCVL
ncbi:MAG: hypothetical protein PHG00_14025 [Methylococcales bacterium]|nr:hypothetical protein [Methylococcales bacterium]